MRSDSVRITLGLVVALGGPPALAQLDLDFGGHLKGRALVDHFPDDSVFAGVVGSTGASAESELRLQLQARHGAFSVEADYQMFAILGDNLRIANELTLGGNPTTAGVLDDQRRWFDLTDSLASGSDAELVHRFDRLALTWTSEHTVVRFGRQALSWGNGLFFSPFDIVNPLDPATIDTEYKTGDDTLYGQYLADSGSDLQIAWVRRRDPLTGKLSTDESTVAAKYHHIAEDREYDLLLASNRGRDTFGAGASTGLGGAILRADLLIAEGMEDWRTEFLVNLNYSWTWGGRNVTGAIEYYYNGWGLQGSSYSVADLLGNPELAERLARGETFTIGRHYLGAGATIEVNPLWLLTPNLLMNLQDPSALLQVISQYSLGDNLTFLAALNLPLGASGSEFGGIEALQPPATYFSRSGGVFAQIAWYF